MSHRAVARIVLASLGILAGGQLLAQPPGYSNSHDNTYRLPPSGSPPATAWPIAQLEPTVPHRTIELAAPSDAAALGESTEIPIEATSWILPDYWFNSIHWEGGIEIGINGTAGNAEALSIRTGGNMKRTTDLHKITADVTYLKAKADGIESQHNALFNSGIERILADSRWTFFVKDFLEYDEFKAFDLRFAANAGIGYQLIDTDSTELNGRYGAGTSYEIGGPNDKWIPELVYGVDFKRQLTERQKLSLTVDFFPEWRDFTTYRLVTDFGWEVLLDEAHNLNLKLSVNDRYDSTPEGASPNDVNYALLLLWKM